MPLRHTSRNSPRSSWKAAVRHRLLQTVLELGLLLLGVVQGLPDPLQVDKRLAERHVVAKVHRFTVILGKQRP
jgi:hypothetical protein|tara:strand:- start:34 stop:252 length:219 start_codon:yes stop_codon:yes gene_type:complete